MRTKLTNILATTGVTLVLLSLIATLYGAQCLFIRSVFEALGANVVIHLGFLVTQKFESRYLILDSLLDIGYTVMVLLVFGAIFNWYSSTPIWILILMAVIVYAIGFFINIFRAREEIRKINQLLENRNK